MDEVRRTAKAVWLNGQRRAGTGVFGLMFQTALRTWQPEASPVRQISRGDLADLNCVPDSLCLASRRCLFAICCSSLELETPLDLKASPQMIGALLPGHLLTHNRAGNGSPLLGKKVRTSAESSPRNKISQGHHVQHGVNLVSPASFAERRGGLTAK